VNTSGLLLEGIADGDHVALVVLQVALDVDRSDVPRTDNPESDAPIGS
jgi:hypothetical protein